MAEQSGQYSGQTFGNYRLIRLLGRGGFAEVYLSQHIYLNTHAAIKALHTQLNTHEQEYFLNEARTIARLIHPHIIRVLDFGMQYEVPYLVMDYAPNGSLRDRHPKGSILPLGQVISYVQDVASALQYAHNEKLIHRDIKPENMLVGNNHTILLSDFGISAIAHTTQSQHLQEVVGTVPYMAPEQLEGKPRAASDQYSLAITVFEWLNGDRPFQGSFTEIYSQQMFTPPPSLRIRNPSIPPAVEQVIITALSKDPHQRFASIQDFAHALERAAENHDPVEHDAPTVREVVEHDAPTIGETDFHTMHSQLTEAEPRASQSLQTMNMEQPILETPPRRHKEKPARRSRQRIPRRSFLIASGGLIVA
ncbi:MAG: serine/threonine protein kinase, partial [Ktedonobacteraceae bacterium]|nr:serine/threonine protein kinase [Ktedonobacteraceae bacterium]